MMGATEIGLCGDTTMPCGEGAADAAQFGQSPATATFAVIVIAPTAKATKTNSFLSIINHPVVWSVNRPRRASNGTKGVLLSCHWRKSITPSWKAAAVLVFFRPRLFHALRLNAISRSCL